MRTPTQRYASYAIAAIMSICAGLGLLYNAVSIAVSFADAFQDHVESTQISHYFPVFYTMSGICVFCYLAIIASSIGLALGSASAARVLGLILVFEIIYTFMIPMLCGHLAIGKAVNSSLGVANGGLSIQFILLLPIVVPIALGLLGLYGNASQGSDGTQTEPTAIG